MSTKARRFLRLPVGFGCTGQGFEALAEDLMAGAEDDEGIGIRTADDFPQRGNLAAVDGGEEEDPLSAGIAALRRAAW